MAFLTGRVQTVVGTDVIDLHGGVAPRRIGKTVVAGDGYRLHGNSLHCDGEFQRVAQPAQVAIACHRERTRVGERHGDTEKRQFAVFIAALTSHCLCARRRGQLGHAGNKRQVHDVTQPFVLLLSAAPAKSTSPHAKQQISNPQVREVS